MSADFWAGYISGAVGILIGNPLDLIKVRLQADKETANIGSSATASTATAQASRQVTPSSPASSSPPSTPTPPRRAPYFPSKSALVAGTAAPVLGYGALNALLFVSYNRTESLLNEALSSRTSSSSISSTGTGSNLWTTWIAGAVGGLATWAVSTPTELVKCRAQVLASSSSSSPSSSLSSWAIAKHVLRTEGIRGLYLGGAVTALRDSVGYGFYFWSYELGSRWAEAYQSRERTPLTGTSSSSSFFSPDAAKILLCGGVAGVVTWASVFPLDVVKTRVQTQMQSPLLAVSGGAPATTPLLLEAQEPHATGQRRLGAVEIAKEAYREGGMRVFFRGLAVCSVRAFVVNAVQWAVYEWIMLELGQGRRASASVVGGEVGSSSSNSFKREREAI
ncbi:mitochondrial carrier domain-containing protein [Biscogniauxia mediterranea]|nr:mitochondrial carrier domain-containing protein [Biscogniauxia mediterranea]